MLKTTETLHSRALVTRRTGCPHSRAEEQESALPANMDGAIPGACHGLWVGDMELFVPPLMPQEMAAWGGGGVSPQSPERSPQILKHIRHLQVWSLWVLLSSCEQPDGVSPENAPEIPSCCRRRDPPQRLQPGWEAQKDCVLASRGTSQGVPRRARPSGFPTAPGTGWVHIPARPCRGA